MQKIETNAKNRQTYDFSQFSQLTFKKSPTLRFLRFFANTRKIAIFAASYKPGHKWNSRALCFAWSVMTIGLSINGCSYSKNQFDEKKNYYCRRSGCGGFKVLTRFMQAMLALCSNRYLCMFKSSSLSFALRAFLHSISSFFKHLISITLCILEMNSLTGLLACSNEPSWPGWVCWLE